MTFAYCTGDSEPGLLKGMFSNTVVRMSDSDHLLLVAVVRKSLPATDGPALP